MLGSVRRNRKILCFYLVSGTAEVKQAIHDVNFFSAMLFLYNIDICLSSHTYEIWQRYFELSCIY